MAVAIDRLSEQDLTRAQVITTFFFCGIGSGHRMRLYYGAMPDVAKARETAQALFDSLDLHRDDPFCGGWRYGWELELGKGDE